jgi:hypothetical protein
MGKWIVTVDDKDDVVMRHLAHTDNYVFIKESRGVNIDVLNMEQATLGDVE